MRRDTTSHGPGTSLISRVPSRNRTRTSLTRAAQVGGVLAWPCHGHRGTVGRKVDQLRKAQESGHLDPSWDPIDILVFLNQIAMAWADRLDLVDAAADQVRDLSPAARRAVVVAAVQRLFLSAANCTD